MARSTVRDIAVEAGVSIATVSRVLNGQDNVTAATRARVEAALAARGAAAPSPRIPAAVRSGPVFVRCPYVLSDYFGPIVSSIAEALDLHGRTMVLDAGESAQSSHPLTTLPARAVSGAVLVLPPEEGDELVALRRRGFPFVVVDPRVAPPRDIAAVSAAHFAGARQVTQHLLALGHRQIGVVAGPREWVAGNDRYAGHAAAMVDVGVLPPAELVRFTHATADDGERAAGELLDLPGRPTALVCFNDQSAVGALRAAAARGLRVPDDLSVAGFDDLELSRATTPQLTTVRQPLGEMGRIAVSLLVRLLERHKLDALHVELATELVVRGSTGPVPPSLVSRR
jgi:LacI family transcriptional regulator